MSDETRLEILRLERDAAEREDALAVARHPHAAVAALTLGLPASAFAPRGPEPEVTAPRGGLDRARVLRAELTRTEILEARRDWLADGPKSLSIHRRVGVSKSTLIRARHDLGLVPWPGES